LFQLSDGGIAVIDVAKNNRARGACLLAGGEHFAVAQAAVLALGGDTRLGDALHAEGALFHYAARAHGDLGVAHELELRCGPVLVAQEVKPPDLPWAVVGAIAGADAAVINHVVDPLAAVHSGVDGADQLAGSLFAVHAEHGLEVRPRIRGTAVVVLVDAQPLHLAAHDHLVFADDGHIVFRLAGDHAGIAADAAVEINGHSPGVPRVAVFEIETFVAGWRFGAFVREVRVLLVFVQRGGAHQVAALNVLISLARSQHVVLAGRAHLHAGRDIGLVGESELIRIDALGGAGFAGARAAAAQEQREAIVGMPGLDPHGNRKLAPAVFDFDDICILRAIQAQPLRSGGADVGRIVPGELAARLGGFLQPAVVGEAPVVDIGVLPEDDLDALDPGGRRRQAEVAHADAHGPGRKSRALDEAIVHRLPPPSLEVS